MAQPVRVALRLVAILAVVGCARPPRAEIEAARAAVAALGTNADLLTYAPGTDLAAREALAALEEELAAQARKGPFERKYDSARTLAVRAAFLAERAGRATSSTST